MLALGPPLGLPPPRELPDDGTVKTGLGSADSQKFKQVYSQVLLLLLMLVNTSDCYVVNRHLHDSYKQLATVVLIIGTHTVPAATLCSRVSTRRSNLVWLTPGSSSENKGPSVTPS